MAIIMVARLSVAAGAAGAAGAGAGTAGVDDFFFEGSASESSIGRQVYSFVTTFH